MTPRTLIYDDDRLVLFRDGRFPVYLRPDGFFGVREYMPGRRDLNFRWQFRPRLIDIDKLIAQWATPVKLIRYGTEFSARELELVEAVEVTPASVVTKAGRRENRRVYGRWYFYDARAVRAVKALIAKRKRFDESIARQVRAVLDACEPVDPQGFRERVLLERNRDKVKEIEK